MLAASVDEIAMGTHIPRNSRQNNLVSSVRCRKPVSRHSRYIPSSAISAYEML